MIDALARRPATVRREGVDELSGLLGGPDPYLELLGIVARVVAVDTFDRALGRPVASLPEPRPGEPTRAVNSLARPGAAWVPMVGGSSITHALSMVPEENAEVERLHGALYLTYAEISDPLVRRSLNRAQMELVAARTSVCNECFY